MPISAQGWPLPRVAPRSASIPQVGANSHDTGCSQPGSTETGISRPQIIQTGHSKRLPSMNAERKRTRAEAKRKPSDPIAPIIAGTAATNATHSWIVVLSIKIAVALSAGLFAYLHTRARSRAQLAAYGGLSGIASLVALVLGVLLSA